jgi:sugar phosphate isomerase/epimerase
VQRSGKNLVHFHLADSNRLPTGEGTGFIPTVIEALKKTGFDC